MKKIIAGFLFACVATSLGACVPPHPKPTPIEAMPVVFQASFDEAGDWKAVDAKSGTVFKTGQERRKWLRKNWLATDAKAWKIAREGGNGFLSLYRKSDFEPRVKSLQNFVLLPDVALVSFVLDLKMRSTSPASKCRSLCVVFGYQTPTQYYYAHIANITDVTSHAILVVDGQDRRSIVYQRTAGVDWKDGWHHVRIVRRWGDGAILVYFDDMSAPIINAADQRFDLGRIGIGSFDDLGDFDEIKLRGVRAVALPRIAPEDSPPPAQLHRGMTQVPPASAAKKGP